MTLEEAMIIAQRMEEDGVCGPVGLALRVLLAENKALNDLIKQLEKRRK